jgi:uncharacterized UPF0160 family protein
MAQKIIATHNGGFHADDVTAVAVLLLLYPDAQLIRTRDAELVAAADFAVNVGGIWDPQAGRFDHRQRGFDGRRPSGVMYASSGLVWAAHGLQFVQRVCPLAREALAARVHQLVDDELVQYLDQMDTGQAQVCPGAFGLSSLVAAFNTTREEESALHSEYGTGQAGLGAELAARLELSHFLQATKMVQTVLKRVVRQIADELSTADAMRTASVGCEGGAAAQRAWPGLAARGVP